MFCRALNPEDGLYYEAIVEDELQSDGLLSVAILGSVQKLRVESLKLKRYSLKYVFLA